MNDSVGSRLREARSRRKLSLADIEAATKIRVRYLRAIENEEWDQLPEDTYARAFIRTYGRHLGLDGERLAEEHRRSRGAERPGERLPRVDPRPRPATRKRPAGRRTVPSGLIAGVATAVGIAALLVIALSTGGSEDSGDSGAGKGQAGGAAPQGRQRQQQPAPEGHTLVLAATGEVWVCLLDGRDRPLVDGAILAPGESEGPFRSGSFTVALGNGAVTMTVDGREKNLPEPSSPIGFGVESDGSVRELPEGERPTCT